jgi:tetratricopeptide (TPR) repeat protein
MTHHSISATESQDPGVHRVLAEAKRAQGDELGALAHLIAAQTLDVYLATPQAFSATELCNVATGYFMKGDHEAALRWYGLVLAIDSNQASAYQNLAAIHSAAGRIAEAEACRERAYRIQRVYVESAGDQAMRVLILCVGRSSGNVPFDTLLPAGTSTRIKYAIDYAAEDEDKQLPPYDLVFNAIGDADIAAPLAARLERFANQCGRPLLNAPSAVARTQRHQLSTLIGDLEDVAVVPCIRSERQPVSSAALAESLAGSGIGFPVLARPAATHGGEALGHYETLEALEQGIRAFSGAHYITTFCDFRSADGYYRKYRIIFVDRKPFPYHLAISSNWMVHYFSADMDGTPWKLDEERRFLEDPRTALGARAMAAVMAIGQRLGLDYGGIDFTLLPDGRVFVFEANATMLVHRERENGVLAYKNRYVQRIVGGFGAMLEGRKGGVGRF